MILNSTLILPFALVRFASPRMLLFSFLLFGLLLLLAILRRPGLPPTSRVVAILGVLCLVMAAGDPHWRANDRNGILVMVDLSASTRGAEYRDAAVSRRRIDQLLGKSPHHIRYFSRDIRDDIPSAALLPDLPGDRTIFAPPPAGAILLFSDARFDLPETAAPTYVVIDPLLESPGDVAIVNLEQREDSAAAAIRNGTRESVPLTVIPAASKPHSAPPGTTTHLLTVRDDVRLTIKADPTDLWPENDSLSMRTLPADRSERWWISNSDTPQGWRGLRPQELPNDSGAYLFAALIVLDNISAPELTITQQQLLHRYVHEFGGGLLILGGDRAFAAGDYPGTPLEALSPLASTPPTPTVHWVILVDASGSMAESADGGTKWEHAHRAVIALLPRLPPKDAVSIGSFAQGINWWSQGKSAAETAALELPPRDVRPSGPTNLEAALNSLASVSHELPVQVLMLTDGQGSIAQFDALSKLLNDRRIRLHVLAVGEDSLQLARLMQLSKSTGGLSLRELNPEKWIEAARRLFTLAAPPRVSSDPISAKFVGDASSLPRRDIAPWNQLFLKQEATLLAESSDGKSSLAARWNAGAGRVIAVAFSPSAPELGRFVSLAARPPRDPRLKVTWNVGRRTRVNVDAVDGQEYLNELKLLLEIRPENGAASTQTIPQTAPGQYESSIDAPTSPATLAVRHERRIVDHLPLPGRYLEEFDRIGNDHRAMKELASRTGGRVIPPAETRPIRLTFPTNGKRLTPWLAAFGSLLISASLIIWRRAA